MEMAYSIRQTTGDGYVIAGYTNSFGAGDNDAYVVKTDDQGDTLWTRTYGGAGRDDARYVTQTADGGYIIAGNTFSFGATDCDYYLVKTDGAGDTLWTRRYDRPGSQDFLQSAQPTNDGGYILAGNSNPIGASVMNFLLVKTDSAGDTLWTHAYGALGYDFVYSVQQTADDGFIVAGYTDPPGAPVEDAVVLKTDSNGDSLWMRTYGGMDSDKAHSVQQTDDGGYIFAGTTISYGAGLNDFYLVKTDSNGDTLWTRTFGGSGVEIAYSVLLAADGGYVIAGSVSISGAGDCYLVKTDSAGDTLWTRILGSASYDGVNAAGLTADGGYILAGYNYATDYNFYVIKTGPEPPNSAPLLINTPLQYSLHPNFPNPFNAATTISYDLPQTGYSSLRVFDLLGREVAVLASGVAQAGSYHITFDGSHLASGLYYAQLETGEFSRTRKLVLLK